MRRHNIYYQWWMTLIVIPLITFVTWMFMETADSIIYSWMFIFIFAIVGQFFLNRKHKEEDKSLHFLFIVFTLLLSMFVVYTIQHHGFVYKKLNEATFNWLAKLITSAYSGLVSYLLKMLIWALLSIKFTQLKNVQIQRDILEERLKVIEEEKKELESRIEQNRPEDQEEIKTPYEKFTGLFKGKKDK